LGQGGNLMDVLDSLLNLLGFIHSVPPVMSQKYPTTETSPINDNFEIIDSIIPIG